MTQNEPLTLKTPQATEQTAISPAVAEIMERAHTGALLELERFAADEINPIRHALRDGNALIGYILGIKQANPADFSRLITLKRQLREQEAANDETMRKTA